MPHIDGVTGRRGVSFPMDKLTPRWDDYELVDSGGTRKLERFGDVTLVRPEAQARWSPSLPKKLWEEADGEFVGAISGKKGQWKFRRTLPAKWEMRRRGLNFLVRPAPSGHVGVFPDQASHWDWIAQVIRRASRQVKVLSLFGHTGLATLAAAAVGAEVTHVDASRQAVAWARENQVLSGLSERPVRWIVEDALTFVRREGRRRNQYEAMVIDPPRFGRGPKGEVWRLDESLPELLRACREVLTQAPLFVLLNVYVTVLTRGWVEQEVERVRRWLAEMAPERKITVGDLGMEDRAGRRIVAAVFARAG